MNEKRFNKLKEICERTIKEGKELSDKLHDYYSKTEGKCFNDFLLAFPEMDGRKDRAFKELEELGIDFSEEHRYFGVDSILMVLNAIQKEVKIK